MKRLLGATCLTVACLLLASGATWSQTRKPPTKSGTVEIIQSKDNKYRFSVRDEDGKYLGGCAVGHATEKEAREAVEELKTVMATASYISRKHDEAKDTKPEEAKEAKKADSRSARKAGKSGTIELIKSKDDKFRFTVRDAEGDYVGGSVVGHETEKEAREAAENLKKVLANATIVNKKHEDKDK